MTESAQATVVEIRDDGRRAIVLRSDVRQEVAVASCFDHVTQELGVPDILVNSAGLNMAGVEVADINLASPVGLMRTALHTMHVVL